jgi:serine/threonine protein kinase
MIQATTTTPQPKPHIQSGSNTIEPAFVSAYFRYFDEGGSLNDLCNGVYQKLIGTQAQLLPEQKRENLLIAKYILTTVRSGYNSYLQTTIWTRFQNFLYSFFGTKRDPDEGISKIDQKLREIETLIADQPQPKLMRAAVRKAQIIMARSFTSMLGKSQYFPVGYSSDGSSLLPSRILLTKPEKIGAVCTFNPTKQEEGNGAIRRYYKGKEHLKDGRKESVGILTTAPTDETRKGPQMLRRIANATKETLQESELLKKLKHPNITSAGSYVSATVNNLNLKPTSSEDSDAVPIGFRVTKFNEFGDLSAFIKSRKYELMTDLQKLEFMESLIKAYVYLHENGYIHRDTKTKNIVVIENQGRFEAEVIDCTTCVSPDYQSHLYMQRAGTQLYWPPEYIDVINKAEQKLIRGMYKNEALYQQALAYKIATKLPAVTTARLDTWGVGLALFHFVYGRDLMIEVLDCKNIKEVTPKFNSFLAAINSETPSKNPRWESIRLKIKQEPKDGVWNTIIRPMLSSDPKQRPTMSGLLQKLGELKSAPPAPSLRFSRIF